MFNTVNLKLAGVLMPGKNAAEKQANWDEHGVLWLVIEATQYGWVLESMASEQRAFLMPYQSPGRNLDPVAGRTLELRRTR